MDPSFWRERRVLVTGHTGFKGAWLCLLLQRLGAQVSGYALEPPTEPSLYRLAHVADAIDSHTGDVRDLKHLARVLDETRPQVLMHLAACSVVLDAYDAPVDTFATNLLGTVHVLEAVRRARRPVAVLNVTTDKCYRNEGWAWGYREQDALGGRDPYASSKACAELAAAAYRASYFAPERLDEHGVAIACARAGNVIGGGDWTPHQLVPAARAAFAAGRPVTLRSPQAVRPWQHVLDCLDGYLTLAQALVQRPLVAGSEWNIGPADDAPVSVSQLVEMMAVHWRVRPAWTAQPGEGRHEEAQLRLDTSKTRALLGWRARLSTAQAVAWTARWDAAVLGGRDARQACEAQIGDYLALVADTPRVGEAP